MIPLAFALDLFDQFGFGSLQVVSEFHSRFQSLGIDLETLSQLLCGRIVKEGNVLVEIRHDQIVAQFLVTLHVAKTPANDGFEFAQGHERLHVEQFDAAGLQHRGECRRDCSRS